jgi:hypothetical protein
MTIIQKLRARRIIAKVARQQGISTAQCRAEIMAAITAAWTTSDSQAKDRQIRLVGDYHTPSPEELILLISKETT